MGGQRGLYVKDVSLKPRMPYGNIAPKVFVIGRILWMLEK